MSGLLVAAMVGVAVGLLVAAVWIHHGYAWRGYQAAKAAVPPARRNWLSRLADLVRVLAVIVIAIGILWAYGGRDSGD